MSSFISLSNYNQAATIHLNDIFNDLENNNGHAEQCIHPNQELVVFSNPAMFDYFDYEWVS